MAERLHDVIKLPFFRYQKVDLFRECPFWQEDGSCMNRACAVEETEEVGFVTFLLHPPLHWADEDPMISRRNQYLKLIDQEHWAW